MKIKLALILICFFLFTSPIYALTVTLTNLTTEVLQNFFMPNGVNFGPLGANATVTLPANLNARLANQVGPVVVTSRFGNLSCGTVFFFNGVTVITIQAVATGYINCIVNSV